MANKKKPKRGRRRKKAQASDHVDWDGMQDAAKHSETVIARGVLDISRLLDEVGDHKIVVILRALNKTEARLLFQELVRSLPPAMVATSVEAVRMDARATTPNHHSRYRGAVNQSALV